MRSEWFAVGLFDVATFHMVLSNSAAHIDQLRGAKAGEKGVDAEKYHLLALQSINQRLARPELDVTEGLISAVAGFVCHAVCILHEPMFYIYSHTS